ncbi:MAG: hypothetical protein IPO06_23525 [Leptospiraceae bacterium]|nr:hypothetical protein [Leptospiraceae bacterium]MBK9502292.1 hypothetical protein [Leptospiraceae bacterium]
MWIRERKQPLSAKTNPLHGLPSIPEPLHTLLGTSQAGYIGSQAVTQMVAAGKEPEQRKEDDKKEPEVK